jgi:hypothetical protein
VLFDLSGRPMDSVLWQSLSSFSLSDDHRPTVSRASCPWYSIAAPRALARSRRMQADMLALLRRMPTTRPYTWSGPGW